MSTTIEEAETFLYRYPHAITDADDPIELLRELVKEAKSMQRQLNKKPAPSSRVSR